MKRNRFFAERLQAAGLDLTKDYFSLSSYDISIVDTIRKSFNYSGRNYLGRSRSRQFWYAAQAGAVI